MSWGIRGEPWGIRGEWEASEGHPCPWESTTEKDRSPCQRGFDVVRGPYIVVRERGVEPPRPKRALAPEASASAIPPLAHTVPCGTSLRSLAHVCGESATQELGSWRASAVPRPGRWCRPQKVSPFRSGNVHDSRCHAIVPASGGELLFGPATVRGSRCHAAVPKTGGGPVRVRPPPAAASARQQRSQLDTCAKHHMAFEWE